MTGLSSELKRRYAEALAEHLATGGEGTLLLAYEIGRAALGAGVGLLEIAALHQQALASGPPSAGSAARATQFFHESLSAYEMALRGYESTTRELATVNRELERQNGELRAREEDLRSRTEALRVANEALARASTAKSRFLADMSHELRTPLNAVVGFSEILLDEPGGSLSEEHRSLVGDIHEAGRSLLRLINDVLDLARVEADRVDLHIGVVQLDVLVDEAFALLAPAARSGGVTLRSEISRGARVTADHDRLRQIVLNLLSNAVRFSPSGATVRVTAEPDGTSATCIHVVDAGPGIAAADIERLFQPFSRLAGQDRESGSGLGLSIARGLVERMNGRIGVTSVVGQGADFWVRVPTWTHVASAETPEPARGAPVALPPCRVLMVEDGPANRRLVHAFLRGTQVTLIDAIDGASGLAEAKASVPDVILMDMRLPDMEGLDVVARLRADPATQRVPIIGLSAQAMAGDRETAIAAGCDDYLTKPIARDVLFAALARQLGAHV